MCKNVFKTLILLAFIISSCRQDFNNAQGKLPLIFAIPKEPTFLNDSLLNIIKEYKTLNKPKYLTLFSRSMPNRNNVFLLSGVCGYEIMEAQKPNAYAILDTMPIFFYGIDEVVYGNRKENIQYENAIKNLVGGDTLPCLYHPQLWVVEVSKDSIKLDKSIKSYYKRVVFYHPSEDF